MAPGHPLTGVVLRRLRVLMRYLTAGVRGDVRAVHQARVASRRLRETVPLVAAAVGEGRGRKRRRTLRKLTRALGTVREMDVALAMLAERAIMTAAPRPALELVRARLNRERSARRRAMTARVSAIDHQKLSARVREAARSAGFSRREAAWRSVLARRLGRRAIGLRDAIEAAGALYEPEALHKVRIAVKKLRYALELADEAGTVPARAEVRLLKTMQDALGRLHDVQVLRAHVQAVASARARRQAVPVEALDAVARAIDGESRSLHARYMAVMPRLRDLGLRVTRAIVPAVRTSVVGRARPIKMTRAVSIGRSGDRVIGRSAV